VLSMYVAEPNPSEYIDESQEEKAINHPEYLTQRDDFKVLICMNCGFAKFFRFPPF
jgi:hypothetical protein